MVELNVEVIVLRALDTTICQNATFKSGVQRLVMERYQPPRDDEENCRMEEITETLCTSKSEYSGTSK